MCDQQSLRSACAYAQSDQSLCQSLEYSMTVKLLTKHHLEFLSLEVDCTGSSESIHVKMPHCWQSLVAAYLVMEVLQILRNGIKLIADWVYNQITSTSNMVNDCFNHSMYLWYIFLYNLVYNLFFNDKKYQPIRTYICLIIFENLCLD